MDQLEKALRPKFEHVWLALQWHAGFAGMGKGWDQKMTDQINQLGADGFQMVSAVQQKDPTWYILFFLRQMA
ncbi:MAG TPA: hypothetical protein VNF73_11785 [Candidatus Saccharimonadales bacterium]|nr:hypothetical protein [Candidatus Saccharimonadales bacterium]